MNYMYTLLLGSTDFPKTLMPIKKPRCQRSDIKEVHNLNFRHCLGVLAYGIWKYLEYGCHLTHSCMRLASMWTLERQSLYVVWRLYILKSRLLLWKQLNMRYYVFQNLLHDFNWMCILKPAHQGYIYIYIYTYIYICIQGVPRGMDKTSGECSLCCTIPM